MTRTFAAALVAAALLLFPDDAARAKTPPQSMPPPLKVVAMPGTPCECVLPPDTRIPSVARFFLYEERVSPYLTPHRN